MILWNDVISLAAMYWWSVHSLFILRYVTSHINCLSYPLDVILHIIRHTHTYDDDGSGGGGDGKGKYLTSHLLNVVEGMFLELLGTLQNILSILVFGALKESYSCYCMNIQ